MDRDEALRSSKANEGGYQDIRGKRLSYKKENQIRPKCDPATQPKCHLDNPRTGKLY